MKKYNSSVIHALLSAVGVLLQIAGFLMFSEGVKLYLIPEVAPVLLEATNHFRSFERVILQID